MRGAAAPLGQLTGAAGSRAVDALASIHYLLRPVSSLVKADPTALAPQQELEALSLRLEDRASVTHLAWAFALACVAFVMGGVAIKLLRDSVTPPKIAYVLAGAAVIEVLTSAVRLVRGLRLHQSEIVDFDRMLLLRRELGVDRPRLPAP